MVQSLGSYAHDAKSRNELPLSLPLSERADLKAALSPIFESGYGSFAMNV